MGANRLGNGRMQMLGQLDRFCNDPKRQELLYEGLAKEFETGEQTPAVLFFNKYVLPYIPKLQETLAESVWGRLAREAAEAIMEKQTVGIVKEPDAGGDSPTNT